ncbi:XamI family restriction endonuclease [Halobacteriaceae archaeon GCM10025711]
MLSDPNEIDEEAERSGEIERNTYLTYIREEYDNNLQKAADLYDITAEKTDNFRDITAEVIRDDPRIVMILRFLVKPTISQMKFGALVGLRSTRDYESFDQGEVRTPNTDTAESIAAFAAENLSPEKAPWVFKDNVDEEEAIKWSRLWVSDKVAEQRAETNYRNARAAEQEQKTIKALKQAGYTRSSHKGLISSKNDIEVGTYVPESRVAGEDTKKQTLRIAHLMMLSCLSRTSQWV